MASLDPRRYVDREAQQALLTAMVAGDEPARVLVIRDASGQGKTDLLQRMRVNCRDADEPPPVLLMDLRDLSRPFGLVERTAHQPANRDTVLHVLSGFVDEYERRSSTINVAVSGDTHNDVTVQGDVGTGGVAAGIYINSPTVPGLDSQILAQGRVTQAFLDDLRAWHGKPIVLLIDHFNKTAPEVRQWVDEELVRPAAKGTLQQLVIVLASTPEHASGYDDLAPAVRISTLDRLEEDRQLVKKLLVAHGLIADDDQDEDTLDFAMTQLAKGRSVLQIVNALASLTAGSDGGG